MPEVLSYLLAAIYGVSIVGVIVVIISENRNPLKSLPWLIVLLLAPLVGLVFYFFFGQNLSKRRNLSRRSRKQVETFLEHIEHQEHPELPGRFRPLSHLLSYHGQAVPLYGTQFEIFTSGMQKMESLLRDIREATHHIHIQYYIIEEDRAGQMLLEALIERARAGVKVRLLYDDVGSLDVRKRFFDELVALGGEVYPFLHVQFPRFTSKVNYRNHRKEVIIDGRVGYLGGMNIADRYLYGSKLGPWRDTHFRLTGGGVAGLQRAFLQDWYATTRQRLEGPLYYPDFATASCAHVNTMQLLSSGPFGKWRVQLQATSMAVMRARSRIWIETPYFLPSETLNNALQTAALAGVDVRLVLPLRSDSRVVDLAIHSYIDDMMRAGVKIYFYMAGFLHSKLMLIDDELSVFGSSNMDFRSFEHNFEINAFVYDSSLVERLTQLMEEDLTRCHLLTPSEWFNRPRLRKFAESVMRLFSPLL